MTLCPSASPDTQVWQPCEVTVERGSSAQLNCTFSKVLQLEKPSLTWVRKQQGGDEVRIYPPDPHAVQVQVELDSERFQNQSDARILLKDLRVQDSGMYWCSITILKTGKEYRGKGTRLTVTGAVLVLTGPSSHVAPLGSDVVLTCAFHPVRPPVNRLFLAITWYFQGKEILTYNDDLNVYRPGLSLDLSGTNIGDASLLLSKVKISDEGVYKCLVVYSPDREEKVITLSIQACPVVTVTRTSVSQDEENILHCSVTGFYPSSITISWFRGKSVLNRSLTYKHKRNSDGTYNLNSTVVIIPTEEHRNQAFSCRVQHASLPEPLQKEFYLVYGGNSVPEPCTSSSVKWLLMTVLGTFVITAATSAIIFHYCIRCAWDDRSDHQEVNEPLAGSVQLSQGYHQDLGSRAPG
ncbi:signal-regulatory protein beta-1-like [Rhinophrynus dorsalis]